MFKEGRITVRAVKECRSDDRRRVSARIRRLAVSMALFLVLCFSVCGCSRKDAVQEVSESSTENIRTLLKEEKWIVHACGRIEADGMGFIYTNSSEALHNVLDHTKHRIIEVDFLKTTDGEVVCGHDWKDLWIDGVPAETELTMEQVKSARMFGKFTPLTLSEIIDSMRKNDRFMIVTDSKYDANIDIMKTIKETAPDLQERFIVSIFNEKEYDRVREMGYKNILFSLYMAPEEEIVPKELIRFAGEKELVGISFWADWADDPAFFAPLRKGLPDMPLMVHTVDDPYEIERYFSMGVDAVFSNLT